MSVGEDCLISVVAATYYIGVRRIINKLALLGSELCWHASRRLLFPAPRRAASLVEAPPSP